MHTLKVICLTIVQLARQLWLFPQTVLDAARKKRRQPVVNEDATERLDRLRNPSKYVGK
jgi:hypothetical protein